MKRRVNWLFIAFILAPLLGFALILFFLTHSFNTNKSTEVNYADDKLYIGFKMDISESELSAFEAKHGLKRLELNNRPKKNLKVGYYEIISGKKAAYLKEELVSEPMTLFIDLKILYLKK